MTDEKHIKQWSNLREKYLDYLKTLTDKKEIDWFDYRVSAITRLINEYIINLEGETQDIEREFNDLV